MSEFTVNKKDESGDVMDPKKEKQFKENMVDYGIAGATQEVVQRYGSANKEHFVSYSGNDLENGVRLKRSLKRISGSKVNPEFKKQNLKQQAGFSAEVKETARTNAENIINGSSVRKIRTDDIPGRVNDPLYDHVNIDSSGNIIDGTYTQMKFVGDSAKSEFEKLSSKKFQKYLDNDVKIEVPSDYYDGIIKEADEKIQSLQSQLDNQLMKGDTAKVEEINNKIKKCQKIKKNLVKSKVSNDDAMLARTDPVLSTVKDIGGISHRAGIEASKTAAIIGGSISVIRNVVSACKGEIEAKVAAQNIVKDTASSAALGYGTAFAGSAIKGAMQNAGSSTVRALSKTNLPAVVVTVAYDSAKIMKRYFTGELTGLECFEALGEQGTAMISSAMFAVIGQAAIPIPIVGGLIGSMVGYAIASASYENLLNTCKEAKYAHDERIRIEQICEEHIRMIRKYRAEMESVIEEYLSVHMELFHSAFDGIKASLEIGDIDGFISSTNKISEAFGRKSQFADMNEFDAIMSSDISFKL